METLRVLHIIDTLDIGGAEKLLVGVVNGLPKCEHHVIYLSGKHTLSDQLPAHCNVVKLGYYSRFDLPRCVYRLRKYIRRHNINIVHSHLFMSSFIARLACPSNCRLISTIHSLSGKIRYNHSPIISMLDKMAYRKRHEIIAVSDEVYDSFDTEVGIKGRAWVLPNFAGDAFFQPEPRKTSFDKIPRLVAVGNLKKVKNYHFLLDSFKFLSATVQLDIYGTGELKESLQQKIDEYNLPVRLCGESDRLPELLPQYDAFIMASTYEGHPLALLEAMASGLPVILSDIPALRKVAGDDALYFKPHDTVALASLLADVRDKKIDLDPIAAINHQKVKQKASSLPYLRKLMMIYMNASSELVDLPVQEKRRISTRFQEVG
ncbi:MAG TPA: glycosyltransferase [Chitinophagaceae bacterium]|jgi:glycosyltransferase involved in cell wall biosynthesis|nr:glycosyltransferase [Chitinophagaceae bacterium]